MFNERDSSHLREVMQGLAYELHAYQTAPSTLYGPKLSKDGDQWCALLGENLQEGVAGFGDTPQEAFTAFDAAFRG